MVLSQFKAVGSTEIPRLVWVFLKMLLAVLKYTSLDTDLRDSPPFCTAFLVSPSTPSLPAHMLSSTSQA